MAKFFVGQRVRILRSENWPELAGSEGRVAGFMQEGAMADPRCEVRVAPDAWGSERCPYQGRNGARRFAPPSSNIEPILPEGSAPSIYTFQQLMDNLQKISAGVGIPSNSTVEASGFLALVRTGGEAISALCLAAPEVSA